MFPVLLLHEEFRTNKRRARHIVHLFNDKGGHFAVGKFFGISLAVINRNRARLFLQYEFTTNTNGEILVPNLKPGSYVVTELEAPAGYVRDTIPQTIEVGTDGGTYKVSFKNQPIGSLVILKKDAPVVTLKRAPASGLFVSASTLVIKIEPYG